jgi:Thiolase, N-terminal domain.
MGCVMQGGLGQAPARQAAKFAGLPIKSFVLQSIKFAPVV